MKGLLARARAFKGAVVFQKMRVLIPAASMHKPGCLLPAVLDILENAHMDFVKDGNIHRATAGNDPFLKGVLERTEAFVTFLSELNTYISC